MLNPRIRVALAVALGMVLNAAAPVMAADSGWYAGGNLGYVRTAISTSAIDASVRSSGAATSATSADENGFGWKLFFGRQINQVLGIEIGYTDFGDLDTSTRTTGPAGTVTGNYEFRAWGLDVVGAMPVGKTFDLFAKLGYYWAKTDARAPSVVGGALTTIGVSDNNSGLKLGVGARYYFNRNLAVRAEWEHFNDVGSARTTGNGSFNLWSAGVQLNF